MSTEPQSGWRRLLAWARRPLRDRLPLEPEPAAYSGPRKPINLALQGGGAYGAFTWGVLDRLLADGRLSISGISGTSAGAMNAVMVAHGLARGGAPAARRKLAEFWRAASGRDLPLAQRLAIERLFKIDAPDNTPVRIWLEAMSRFLSPYAFNPLNINPLKQLIERLVDFDAVRTSNLDLYIAATNVLTGDLRVFTRAEISADVLMASACLPHLFHAVEIDGVPYWDGGYAGNPTMLPHFYASETTDVLLVQINPEKRTRAPRTNHEIAGRINEITFNAPLLSELRAIETIDALIDQGRLIAGPSNNEVQRLRLHRIVLPHIGDKFDAPRARLRTDFELFETLHKLGRRAAQRFLDEHYEAIGRCGTLNLPVYAEAEPAA